MPGLSDSCGVCKTTYLFSLPRCGFCHKPVCANCASRIGGSIFCSKSCGHTFFYGGEEDVEDADGSTPSSMWDGEDE